MTEASQVNHTVPAATDFLEKIHCLRHLLSQDLIACDAKWTLFVSAALSYRFDSQLKPCPPRFATEQGYNIEALTAVISETPKFKILLKNINEENYEELDTEVVELVYWVLIHVRDPFLRSVSSDEYDAVISQIPQKSDFVHPSHIFAVCPTPNSKSEEIFRKQKEGGFGTKFAFHGSKLDNFYSILNHGLHQHMCKNGFFGEGVYLSSELSVSMSYSPFGAGWGASNCGALLSCVAMCEYVQNSEHVKFKEDEKHKSDIPNTYIVITNNDVVRVRYLLFYGRKFPDENSTRSAIIDWISRNRYALSLLCYTLFLTSIGLANSGNGSYLRHVISKKTTHALGMLKKLILGDT